MLKRILSVIIVVLLFSACSSPVPSDKDNSWKDKTTELTETEKEKASDYVNKMFEGSKGF